MVFQVHGEIYIALSLSYRLREFQVLALNDHIGFVPGQVFYFTGTEVPEQTVIGEFISGEN
jgi:hypothetical protein